MARYIAKNLVAAGLADKVEVQLAYAIGVAEPVSVRVDTFGTAVIPEEKIERLVRNEFKLTAARHHRDARPAASDLPGDGGLRSFRPRRARLHLGADRSRRRAARRRRCQRSRSGRRRLSSRPDAPATSMNDADDPKPPPSRRASARGRAGADPPSQIAAILREVADLLELRGENPFRSRAFANGARAIEGLAEDPQDLLRGRHARRGARHRSGTGRRPSRRSSSPGRSRCSPSCGPSFPPECRISCASRVSGRSGCASSCKELRIDSPAALERACREGRVAALPGFGAKSQEKLLQGLGSLQRFGERHLLPVARCRGGGARAAPPRPSGRRPRRDRGQPAALLRDHRRPRPPGERRAAEREAVVDHFLAAPSVLQPIERGTTKAAAVVAGGLRADLRLVEPDEMPSALLHFTGSKEHNVALRSRAKSFGWTLNEYGLHDGENRFPLDSERAIYGQLGLAWIPPEAREGMGEIELAELSSGDPAAPAPALIELADLRGTLHVHTDWSDGIASLETMALAAGETRLGVPGHRRPLARRGLCARPRRRPRPPAVGGDRPLERRGPEALALQGHRVRHPGRRRARLRRRAPARLRLRRGLGPQPFQPLARGDDRALGARRLASVRDFPRAPHGAPSSGSRTVRRRSRRRCCEAARENGAIPELNANPHRLDLDWRQLRPWLAAGGTTSIHPDAHSPRGLTDVQYGIGIARKALALPGQVLNCRPVGELRDYFDARRERARGLLGRRAGRSLTAPPALSS